MTTTLGRAAFIVGVLVAIFGGIWGGKAAPTNDGVTVLLLIAGILIGLLNITAREAVAVMIAVMALIILALWGYSPAFNPVIHLSQGLAENLLGIVVAFGILMAPAAIIIALRTAVATASPGD